MHVCLSVCVLLAYIGTGQVMGWGHKAIEIRTVDTGDLDGVFMHKKPQKLKFLCERNNKVHWDTNVDVTLNTVYWDTEV